MSFYRVSIVDLDEHPDNPPWSMGVQATTAAEAIRAALEDFDDPDRATSERLVVTAHSHHEAVDPTDP